MKSLFICFTLLSSLLFTFTQAANFEVVNNCNRRLWAAASPGGGKQLDPGQRWNINVNPGTTAARIWARTNCNFDANGHGHCETGDCGGLLECKGYGSSPNTLAEYALKQYMDLDFYDISVIDGYNVPMDFIALGDCRNIRCAARIISECPPALRVRGGCNGPCPVFGTDKYCCNSGNCGPTEFSRFFKERCPDAYQGRPQGKPSKTLG